MTWREWHHGYLGAFLILLGIPLLYIGIAINSPTLIVIAKTIIISGIIILIDDVHQHVKQSLGYPNYVSPLHRFFSKYLWKYEKVKKITEWFDNLFK